MPQSAAEATAVTSDCSAEQRESAERDPTLRFRAMRMRPWLVMSRNGVLLRSWLSPSMASASILRVCQLISLNVNT